MAGSEKKKDRLLYADPYDHKFNDHSRFTAHDSSLYPNFSSTKTSFVGQAPKGILPKVSCLPVEEED